MTNVSYTVFAGGCFWCTEAVFSRLAGVKSVVSGYTGGQTKDPVYKEVIKGDTGHVEAVKIFYNENIISFLSLMEIFFATHDPTTYNKQGPDEGPQYRSVIFYADNNQKEQAESFIELLEKERVFSKPIVTTIEPLNDFYNAEKEHQQYFKLHPEEAYCRLVIAPKIKNLKHYYGNKIK
ncbi:peptide-methionine (S)-S-oxide reductase MsrA [Zhouia spongiae]|uniref:Peptide methionine sulfoxide reductase MsrA n=1 Tax=Zhouia spongiae TaxID=2202721 RepID=A0ABY3YKD7_9FLAO|nr:peptide-methionine (S)-S-oxide reductase MsrA [Zhouia spongiae]UNY98126.1 peptide-methionine (S)-S-oxide reductase MsrA [Zhouia spongiae]